MPLANGRLVKSVPPQDEDVRLDPRSDKDLNFWAERLGVPKDELRRAAELAGPRIGDIRQHLVGGFSASGPTS